MSNAEWKRKKPRKTRYGFYVYPVIIDGKQTYVVRHPWKQTFRKVINGSQS